MNAPLNLRFCKIHQQYNFVNGFKITTQVKFIETNNSSNTLEFSDVFMMGVTPDNEFEELSSVQFSYPKRLSANGLDELWVIISENAFTKIKKCAKLYFVLQIAIPESSEYFPLIFEITSPEWLDSSWLVSDITCNQDFRNVTVEEYFLKSLEDARKAHSIIQDFDAHLSKLVFDKAVAKKTHLLKKTQKINADTVKIRIIESEIGYIKAGAECFFILVELENASAEERAFEISNLQLIDCEKVNLTLVGYINSVSPSADVLGSYTKDRFYVGFKTDKTKQKESSLTFKFNIGIHGYDELIEEEIYFEKIGGNHSERIHKVKPPQISANKEVQLNSTQQMLEKIETLTQQLKKSLYCLGNENGLVFDKITLSINENKISIRGLVKKSEKESIDRIHFVVIDSTDRILETQSVLLYSIKKINAWYTFDESFYAPSNKISTIIATL